MLRKKALRNKHRLPVIEVNVVSLMDILTTLLFFLVFAANFTKFSILEGKAFPQGTSSEEDKKPSFALDVTILSKNKARVYLSPVSKLNPSRPNALNQHIRRNFKGNESLGYLTQVTAKTPAGLRRKIQDILIPIKRSFPNEIKAVMTIADPIAYQNMIDLLASIRSVDPGRKAFRVQTVSGGSQSTRVLFPTVLINELGGTS